MSIREALFIIEPALILERQSLRHYVFSAHFISTLTVVGSAGELQSQAHLKQCMTGHFDRRTTSTGGLHRVFGAHCVKPR